MGSIYALKMSEYHCVIFNDLYQQLSTLLNIMKGTLCF